MMSERAMIRITFLGGASEIGASCSLVQVGDTHVLVDCGLRFRPDKPLPDLASLEGIHLDAILVTHAHTDHTGALPLLCQHYPEVPIYLTPPTLDLITILQKDALSLLATERETELPYYAPIDVERTLESMKTVHHGETFQIKEIEVRFLPAAHIIGASMVHLSTPSGNVLFTGDFSVSPQLTVPALDPPQVPVDLLITEATYGDRLHSDRRASEQRLVQRIGQILEKKGRVLIPAFAIGRAQEVLLILNKAIREGQLPETPVYADGMVRSVCGVYSRHGRYVTRWMAKTLARHGHPFFNEWIQPVTRPEDRREILKGGPCVIVASSGMLSGGPSVSYALQMTQNYLDAILITGYQDEESPGRALLSLAQAAGPRRLRLEATEVDVRCLVETYSLSAHADRAQIAGLVAKLRPRTVALVHGDKGAREGLASHLDCHDIELVEDGTAIMRRYPPRSLEGARLATREPQRARPSAEEIAVLIGPPGNRPLSAEDLTLKWYGRPVTALEQEAFVLHLEASGLVLRDDCRRGLVWAVPAEPLGERLPLDVFPEEVLEQEMKALNPKGRLLEYCARLRIAEPRRQVHEDGGAVVSLTLRVGEALFESGPQRASSEKLAEQLACKVLLDKITDSAGERQEVSSTDILRFKRTNPKSQFTALCTRLKLIGPQVKSVPVPGGFLCQAQWLTTEGKPFSTARYFAAQGRYAEQAVAGELLRRVDDWLPTAGKLSLLQESTTGEAFQEGGSPRGSDYQSAAEDDLVESATPLRLGTARGRLKVHFTPGRDARARLNEYRQKGIIQAYGFHYRGKFGSAHLPVYELSAWADVPELGRLEGDLIQAPNKKAGERLAAERLIQRLFERGVDLTRVR